MKALVTGGAGFIGSNLVDALIAKDIAVVVIDNLSTGAIDNLPPNVTFVEMDITDLRVSEVFEKERPDYVFHLAAQIDVRKSVADPVNDAGQNILGSINIHENCKKYGVKKVIFSSTGGAIYGEANQLPTPEGYPEKPISPYGIGKLTTEKYLHYYHHVFGLEYVALRYSNVYGPRQNSKGEAGVVAIFIDKLMAGASPVINGDGSQTRDYVFVGDVVAANIAAMESKHVGIYNVGTAVQTTVKDLAEKIRKHANPDIEIKHGPAKIGEQQSSCISWEKIQRDLQWQPHIVLDDGVEKTIAWFKRRAADQAQQNLLLLEDVLASFGDTFELQDVVASIVNGIHKKMDADACFIYLVQGEDVALSASSIPVLGERSNMKMKQGEGITGWVVVHNSSVVISHRAYTDKRCKSNVELPDGFEGILSVPILLKSNVIGVINVLYQKPRTFSFNEIKLVETLGKQIGSIIKAAQNHKSKPISK